MDPFPILTQPSPPLDPENVEGAVSSRRKAAVITLLLIGLLWALWYEIRSALFSPRKGFAPSLRSILILAEHLAPVLLAVGLTAIPAVRRRVAAGLDRIASPTPKTRRLASLSIAIAATLYFLITATWQQRDLSARQQDESMYLTQAQILAKGRLWMPQHPHPDFFESFHILVKPVYAPIYFPGTALAYAPSVWLGISPWLWAMIIAGAGVGMTYRVITEMLDGVAGALSALLLVAAVIYRHLSGMVMSHPLLMLLTLLMAWAYLRWRREQRPAFAFLCGIFAGWAAITRPLDALAYAIPLFFAVAWEMRHASWRRWAITAVAVLCGAAPLLSLQLIFDHGVTGHWLLTPATLYLQNHWPQTDIGFKGDLTNYHPLSKLPQFQQYYDKFVMPSFNEFRKTHPLALIVNVRLPMLLSVALPSFLLAALLPLALFEIRKPARWGFVLALPFFIGGYATFMFFRKHYGIAVFPPLYLAMFLGAKAVERTWPAYRVGWNSLVALAVLGLAIAVLPELNPTVRDQLSPTPILSDLNAAVRKISGQPALIMVRHVAGKNEQWSQEPVYNVDVAWPDDAPVIRAHDLGERNIELYRYYARQNPQRKVYRFDKSKSPRTLEYLGTVAELSK